MAKARRSIEKKVADLCEISMARKRGESTFEGTRGTLLVKSSRRYFYSKVVITETVQIRTVMCLKATKKEKELAVEKVEIFKDQRRRISHNHSPVTRFKEFTSLFASRIFSSH